MKKIEKEKRWYQMKWYNYLLFALIIFVTVLSSVRGAEALSTPTNYYNFSDASGNFVDYFRTRNISQSGSWTYNSSGIVGTAVLANAKSSYGTQTSITYLQTSNFSVNVWFKPTDVSDNILLAGSGGTPFIRMNNPANVLQVSNVSGEMINCRLTGGAYVAAGVWHMLTLVRAGNNLSVYHNGTYISSCKPDGSLMSGGLQLGWSATYAFTGTYDELYLGNNVVLSSTEVSQLYNSGNGLSYPYAPAISNFSVTARDNFSGAMIQNFSVNIGGINYSTTSGTVTTNILESATILYNVTVFDAVVSTGTFYDVTYLNWNVSNDLLANLSRFAPVFPAITLNPNNAFDMSNYSTENQYDNDMRLNITFADDSSLYAFEINITAPNGTMIFNITNQSLSGLSYTYTNLFNTQNWSAGRYIVDVFVSDSHTNKDIKNYDVNATDKKLEFKTTEGHKITVETDDAAVTEAVKKKDRYEFNYDFKDGLTKKRTFYVKSDSKIDYLENSNYKAHFVVYDRGGNWIDFEGVEGTPKIKKISDFEYSVIFDSLKKANFKSIGGLNIYNATFSWYKGNYSRTNPEVLKGEETILTLNISKDSSISNILANLVYNGTSYMNATSSSGASWFSFSQNLTPPNATGIFSFYWNVTIQQGNSVNYTFQTSNINQSVIDFAITNCSSGSPNRTIILSYFDENSPGSALSASLNIEILSWVSDKANSRNYSASLVAANSHYFCISPPNTTLQADVYAVYTVANAFTHRYILYNITLTNTTQTFSLYNFPNTSGISDLSITARSKSDFKYYPNVLAKLQRKYVGEGVWRTVQMDESGAFGEIIFHIIEQTTDYRIIFTDTSNRILSTTSSSKFLCSNSLCELTYLLDPYSAVVASEVINYVVTFNNNTQVLFLNWSSILGTTETVNLHLAKQTITGELVICDVTQVVAAGIYSCNASLYSGEALLTLKQNNVLIYSEWIILGTSGLSMYLDPVEQAFWTFIIMLTVIGFGLLSPAASIISTIAGLIFVFYLGIFSAFTVTFIVIAAIVGIVIGLKIKQ